MQRSLRNGNTLFQFILTDFTDSDCGQMFARSKEDAEDFEPIEKQYVDHGKRQGGVRPLYAGARADDDPERYQ